MKKIVGLVFHDSDLLSGATHSLLDLVDYWYDNDKYGFVAVFPREGTAAQYLREKGIPVLCCYYWEMRRRSNESLFFSFTRWLLREKLMIESYYNAKENITKFFKKHKVDIIYANTSSSCVGIWLKKWLKKPVLYHIREFGIEDQGFQHFHGEKWYQNKLKKADKIILISNCLKEKYKNILPNKDFDVIYNDVSKKYINQTNYNFSNMINILSCGAVIPGKGHLDIVKAIEILKNQGIKNIKLHIVGNDKTAYAIDLKKYVCEHNLEKFITFAGVINDMNEYRKKTQIGIVASSKEAFGRITIEGMLSKMIMIGSNSGATPELIKHMSNGLLYEKGSVYELAELIKWCIYNIDCAKEIASNGFEFAKGFCEGKAAQAIEKIIDEM